MQTVAPTYSVRSVQTMLPVKGGRFYAIVNGEELVFLRAVCKGGGDGEYEISNVLEYRPSTSEKLRRGKPRKITTDLTFRSHADFKLAIHAVIRENRRIDPEFAPEYERKLDSLRVEPKPIAFTGDSR